MIMKTTKIIEGNWGNGEYKYNVQTFHNGTYAGHGRFFRTREGAEDYIKHINDVEKREHERRVKQANNFPL